MFSDELKNLRTELKLTQKDLFNLFEIPVRTTENWESGKRKPPKYEQNLLLRQLNSMKKNKGDYIMNTNMTYNGETNINDYIPYGAGELFILDGKLECECEFVKNKKTVYNPKTENVETVDADDEHAILRFEDIDVDFVKIKE